MNLGTVRKLVEFVSLCQASPTYARRIDILSITLVTIHCGIPAQMLNDGLDACKNLSTFVLHVPSGFRREFPGTLLSGTMLPNLETFETNLPHDIISRFLSCHPSISALLVQSLCRYPQPCPLRYHISNVADLRCDIACLPSLVLGDALSRLAIDDKSGRVPVSSERKIWREVSPHLTSIRSLEVRTCHNSFNILRSISRYCVELRHICIVEEDVRGASVVAIFTDSYRVL